MKRCMKRFLMLLATLSAIITVVSCSADNGPDVNFHIDFVAADSVSVPTYMHRGQTYPITLYYKRPDDCHFDDGFYSVREGNAITVAIQNIVLENTNCNPVESTTADVATISFQCPLEDVDAYTFRFYKGEDAENQQQFIEVEVPAGF